MVVERFMERYPAAVTQVKENNTPTEQDDAVCEIRRPGQWGRNAEFEWRDAGAMVHGGNVERRGPAGGGGDPFVDALDPRLGDD